MFYRGTAFANSLCKDRVKKKKKESLPPITGRKTPVSGARKSFVDLSPVPVGGGSARVLRARPAAEPGCTLIRCQIKKKEKCGGAVRYSLAPGSLVPPRTWCVPVALDAVPSSARPLTGWPRVCVRACTAFARLRPSGRASGGGFANRRVGGYGDGQRWGGCANYVCTAWRATAVCGGARAYVLRRARAGSRSRPGTSPQPPAATSAAPLHTPRCSAPHTGCTFSPAPTACT